MTLIYLLFTTDTNKQNFHTEVRMCKMEKLRNENRRRNSKCLMDRNFTLIELLVVIAIIAIVVTSKAGFFLQFSAIFAFKAL